MLTLSDVMYMYTTLGLQRTNLFGGNLNVVFECCKNSHYAEKNWIYRKKKTLKLLISE